MLFNLSENVDTSVRHNITDDISTYIYILIECFPLKPRQFLNPNTVYKCLIFLLVWLLAVQYINYRYVQTIIICHRIKLMTSEIEHQHSDQLTQANVF